MSWRNVKLIFAREVRDQLRDRRTLFMIAVLPLLLYPAMGIGMMHMTLLFSEQQRTVVILGAEDLPEQPPLLVDNGINPAWFSIPDHARTLDLITDLPAEGLDEDALAERVRKLTQAEEIGDIVRRLTEIDTQISELTQGQPDGDAEFQARSEQLTALNSEAGPLRERVADLFAESTMDVLIVVPEGFAQHVAEFDEAIRQRENGAEDYPRPIVVRNSANDKSMIAYKRVKEAITRWEKMLLERRLDVAELPNTLPDPVRPEEIDLARDEEKSANLWSKLFPALLIIMAVTGAFYPAIDIGAGEKERGTMETLLICPATRTEIVLGKFFTVLSFSMATAILNIASMGLTGSHMHSLSAGALAQLGDLSMPTFGSMVWMFVLLVPLSAFFSAVCLSLAMFARSSKEGQYYLSPMLMITLGLTVVCLSPATEIAPGNDASWFFCILPIMGPALLLKAFLLSAVDHSDLYWFAIPVLVTSVGYSLLALWWAIDQFKREDILFRGADRFELGLWVKHLLRDKEATPSFSEAGVCFVIIMLLQFGAMRFMGSPEMLSSGLGMMKLLIVQQLALIAIPAIMMGVILTTKPLETFRIRIPSAKMLGVALLLPVALHPLALVIQERLAWFFPKLPDSIAQVMATMGDGNQPLWFVLTAFALAPAVCEEIAFRGFILSGFGRSGRVWLAIGLSSLTFGIMHMIPQQVFNASLLGIVLGLIAVRSRSLLPCIGFHFVFNALAVLHGRFGANPPTEGFWVWMHEIGIRDWLFAIENGQLHYRPLTVAICAGVSCALICWLVMRGVPSRTPTRLKPLATAADVGS